MWIDKGKSRVCEKRLSNSQLISIVSDGDMIYIASIKGEIFCCSIFDESLNVYNMLLVNKNVTCIRMVAGHPAFSTTNGDICIINRTGAVENNVVLFHLSDSRIWKIATNNNSIYCASITGELFQIHLNTNEIKKVETSKEITSLTLCDNTIIYGTRTGELYSIGTEGWTSFFCYTQSFKIENMHFFFTSGKRGCIDNIKLHIEDKIDFNGRLIGFLASLGHKFNVVNHSKDDWVQACEWWKYPFVTFNDTFLASGMLLDEFIKRNVIERLL